MREVEIMEEDEEIQRPDIKGSCSNSGLKEESLTSKNSKGASLMQVNSEAMSKSSHNSKSPEEFHWDLQHSSPQCTCDILIIDEMIARNVVTWTAMIMGLVQNRFYKESWELFLERRKGLVSHNELTYSSLLVGCSGLQALKEGCQFHGLVWKLGMQSDLYIESTLMDMYSKYCSVDDTWKIFESAQVLDEVSMTVILAGFAQNGQEGEALSIFVRIVKAGVEIVPDMITSILEVFGVDASLALGKQIHSLVIKKNFGSDTFVNNWLVNMYSKYGELEESIKFFDGMPKKNSVYWNSMIAAFARHGNVARALELYGEKKIFVFDPGGTYDV